uniref:Uncharacterized protein n=1 Tax=Coccidioides posadasii RMSCC 3488 TaxID=454284 RepID=A0A0J6FBV9_COCPO|nr:hypothetical protein CPAG_04081 [Coccidioides posadasii RMSCC 3488]
MHMVKAWQQFDLAICYCAHSGFLSSTFIELHWKRQNIFRSFCRGKQESQNPQNSLPVPLHPTMTNSVFDLDTTSQAQTLVPWDESLYDAPTPGHFGGTPSTQYSFSPSPHPTLQETDQLGFLPLAGWDQEGEYEENPPRYVRHAHASLLGAGKTPVTNSITN